MCALFMCVCVCVCAWSVYMCALKCELRVTIELDKRFYTARSRVEV